MNLEILATLSGVITGAIGTYIAVIGHKKAREKELIAHIQEKTKREVTLERDFNDLKRTYAVLANNQASLATKLEKLGDEVDSKFEMVVKQLQEIRSSLKR